MLCLSLFWERFALPFELQIPKTLRNYKTRGQLRWRGTVAALSRFEDERC